MFCSGTNPRGDGHVAKMLILESSIFSHLIPNGFPLIVKWRHFLPEIILLNVRWYCRYPLSYRNLEEMMAERGVEVDHSTINRWVLKFAPELGFFYAKVRKAT